MVSAKQSHGQTTPPDPEHQGTMTLRNNGHRSANTQYYIPED